MGGKERRSTRGEEEERRGKKIRSEENKTIEESG